MRLYREFDKIVRALVSLRVRFAVAGALAVNLHGHMRATKDIDLLVREEDLPVIRQALKVLGYRESGSGVSFRASGLGLRRFYQRPAGEEELLVVDVLLVESPKMAGVLDRAVPLKYADFSVPVVAPDDLVMMKMLRGSKQDEADIEKLKAKRRKKKSATDARRARHPRDQ